MDWTDDDLQTLSAAKDFRIAPFREDGQTPGTPTFIWFVLDGGRLYVRAYNGTASSWYRAAIEQKAGEIVVDGERRRVVFEPITDEHTNDAIDEAYRAKHGASQYLAPMISKRARAATVRVRPSTAPA